MTGSDADLSAIASADEYRAIVHGAPESFVAIDAGGFVIDWNAAAEATLGWSRAEAVGRVLAELIIPERYREAHWQGLQRYLETGEGSSSASGSRSRRFTGTATSSPSSSRSAAGAP